jgi:hypothetical protein
MGYADVGDVKGRAGRLASAWDDQTQPSTGDIERFLQDAAGEIDAALAARGLATPLTDERARAALRGWNADAALLVALDGTWPGGTGGADVDALRTTIKERLTGYWAALASGDLPALALLLVEAEGGAGNARSFWTDETSYGRYPFGEPEAWTLSPSLLPGVKRGMRF